MCSRCRSCLCCFEMKLFVFAFTVQVADKISENYDGNPKSPSIQYVALQQSLYITTFICVLGGAFFLATAMFIVQDKKAAERQLKGKWSSFL